MHPHSDCYCSETMNPSCSNEETAFLTNIDGVIIEVYLYLVFRIMYSVRVIITEEA